jgi:hypothetical protein
MMGGTGQQGAVGTSIGGGGGAAAAAAAAGGTTGPGVGNSHPLANIVIHGEKVEYEQADIENEITLPLQNILSFKNIS